jgi:hypothetical protein
MVKGNTFSSMVEKYIKEKDFFVKYNQNWTIFEDDIHSLKKIRSIYTSLLFNENNKVLIE